MIVALEEIVAGELKIRREQVIRTMELLDSGNTVPFIARYRKEVTGGLDEVQIQGIRERVERRRNLLKRQEEVIRLIGEQDKLTPAIEASVRAAETLQEVNDLYLPFRPKRRTRASIAREKGLALLADLILRQERGRSAEDFARPFVNADLGVETAADALACARDIVAEIVSEDAEVRRRLRVAFNHEALLSSKLVVAEKDEAKKYTDYYNFSAPLQQMVPHRVLAINRAEREGVLRVSIDLSAERAQSIISALYWAEAESCLGEQLTRAVEDGYERLLAPALEREIRSALTERAEAQAIAVFVANLRPLLLQPPLRGRRVMGIDPGYRTGCKISVIDETGKHIDMATIYPHPPQKRWEDARQTIIALTTKHGVSVIAIGNGTASRETETLVAEVVAEVGGDLAYAMVSEAGASVYSASEVARQEFPTLEASQRGGISIARRLQDPLAELVKIDPQSIGVGLYQHDVDQKELGRVLDSVVESCVNYAGVDINTASASLLRHVAGINRKVADNIVQYRESHGRFSSRRTFRQVPGLGEAAFTQAAGFLRVVGGENDFDNTFIHPESYDICRRLIQRLEPGQADERLSSRVTRFRQDMAAQHLTVAQLARELGCGAPTLEDILDNLEKPGLDPRDELPKPLLRRDVLKMEDLEEGMILVGTVRNVVDFGAFVDIGVKQDGLVHISQLADRFVANPLDVVGVGQMVTVRVLSVDAKRGRIALTMRAAVQDLPSA